MERRRSSSQLKHFRGGHIIGLGAVLAFSSVLGFGFVYDDAWTIVDNRWLARPLGELLGLLATGEALAKDVPDATRPAMVLSLWLDRRLFGLSPAGPHLVSLLLYGLNCALATVLAARLARKRSVALVTGVFFALAPLHAEPLAAVNYREDLLSGAGVLGAWLCALGPLRRRERKKQEWRRAGAAALAWTLALLAKESSVVLVPLLGMTMLLLPVELRRARRAPRVFGLLLGVGVAWALFRVGLALRGDDIPLSPSRGAVETGLRTARFLCLSVWNALFPLEWGPDHWRQPDASPFWLVLAALLLVAPFIALRARRTRVAALGLAIAMIAPFASSPLVGPVNELADRYFFLGVLGGGLLWGSALAAAGERFRFGKRGRSLLAFVALPLFVPAWWATQAWRDERSLWTTAVERQPSSPRAWAALSRVHRLAGDHPAALAAVERAIALDPSYPPALVTRVYNEIAAGDLEKARAHVADADRRGFGDEKGMKRARRCAVLEPSSARACLEK